VAARQAIADAQADVMVVAAYGLILPQWVLDDMAAPHADGRVRFGCLNIHGSLLPRWRGAAPIHRAIELGDPETGVTIMQMDAGLDTGDMLLKESLPIAADDTTATLHDKVAGLGAQMIVQTLDLASQGALQPRRQPDEGVTYAHKIEKEEAPIRWSDDASSIVRRIRAFNPFPGATAVMQGETLKVWGAKVGNGATSEEYGRIVAVAPGGIAVAAMNSIVIITELQRPGGKRMAVSDFLRGMPLEVGAQFELQASAAPAT
jgi:methionyl-tRNA formyltransferase